MNYESLIAQKIASLNNSEHQSEIEKSRAETPQFSDRKILQMNQTFDLGQQKQQQVIVNWHKLTDEVQERTYTKTEFILLMETLNISVNDQIWKFMLLLAYVLIIILQDEDTWQQMDAIPFERMQKLLGIVFDCVQDINELKKTQVEEMINYRSLAHLNRILYQNKMQSFEKNIKLMREQILIDPHPVFKIEQSKIQNHDSFARIKTFQDSGQSTQKQQLNKGIGNLRSELLYQHSKQIQEKNRHVALIRTKEENEQLMRIPSKIPTKSKSPVHERLYKQFHKKEKVEKKEEICSECTFKPEINKQDKQVKAVLPIKGFEQQMQRMKKAKEEKEYKEKYLEIKHERLRKNNNNSGVKEFKLSEKESMEEPIMYLDVKVSKNRVGRLGVRKGDDPEELVNNFGKAFQLSQEQKEKLIENLKHAYQMIIQH